jgi:5'-nucleotidase
MPFTIEKKLVVAVASSALFDLRESQAVFDQQGESAYRTFQRAKEDETLQPGVAFSFIKRLLNLNALDPDNQPVEVILLSKNDSDTGLRVMNSIATHGLPISRAAFLRGGDPFRYIDKFYACLFLSADEKNVKEAVMKGLPAGRVLASTYIDDPNDTGLRIAFDFDGVVSDDEAERVYQLDGMDKFQESELKKALTPLNPGPLKRFLEEIGRIHKIEMEKENKDRSYKSAIRIAIVTSRNAPAHKRVVTTLRSWGTLVQNKF